MTDPIAFALAAMVLLATPGPTNTLLATSGAAAGVLRSLRLVGAETIGYAFAISVLALVIGPIAQTSQALGVALRLGCGFFLLYVAWRLWREGEAATTSVEPVKFRRVLVATALNPKAAVFAFVIVPYLSSGDVRAALPYAAALTVMIPLAGLAWIVAGAALRAGGGAGFSAGIARRGGALVLCAFAALITGSALGV
jgi:threonine/homoserine/homoserine lactone efflux protein